jgi:TfoX/Sxy family transcriptional regulator of competence genes
MAYDEETAHRIRAVLQNEPNLTEKKMFGGIGFMINGNMAVGVRGRGGLMIRLDPSDRDAALARPHAGEFEMNGKKMAGWVTVDAAGLHDDDALRAWIEQATAFTRTLPPK